MKQFDSMPDQSDYSSAWQDYRRRRLWYYVIWLGGIPVIFILNYLLTKITHSEVPFAVMAVSWMLGFLVLGLRISYFKCPRCNETFFKTFFYHNPFARRCVHCQLPKYQSSPVQIGKVGPCRTNRDLAVFQVCGPLAVRTGFDSHSDCTKGLRTFFL